FALYGCDTTKKTAQGAEKTADVKVVNLPPLVATDTRIDKNAPKEYKLPVYQASAKRVNDLLHTKLDIAFDWKKQYLMGKATLTLKPYFYATNTLELDAQNFVVNSVKLNDEKGAPLKYTYDGVKLTITLDKTYQKEAEYTVFIDYVARPNERKAGGSAAITSDKGLYFINPLNEEKGKPMQIWTQGETEANSFWMPTIDKPNERCTEEMYITVEDKYKTLSNGLLLKETKNADGTRTDYWKMDKPHAPYLFMFAVGEFAVVKDKWRDREVLYYVEPAYEKDAKLIYNHAPEMLEFYSTRLGVDYPWPKMAHIIVREYVSGAMENTTAIIYGDFCQKHTRELLDATNDYIVCHETFHHWFGDLVTCESWSNLTVNESFANYSETLWGEYKYGKDEGDAHLYENLQGYLGQSRSGKNHNLVHFAYTDREDMFDAISYNKGGCALHQLRNYLGDDAFFAGLKEYLTANQYSTGEAQQLRLAMEKVSGEDLNWYWNQWYYSQGHPNLELDYSYDETAKAAIVTIKQTQSPDKFLPIYQLPLDVDVYDASGKAIRTRIRMTEREQSFSFPANVRPALINVDATKSLVGTKKDNHTDEEFAFMYRHAPLYLDRLEAIKFFKNKKSSLGKQILEEALNDKYKGLREDAIGMVDAKDGGNMTTIAKLATSDPETTVRSEALRTLAANSENNAAYATLAMNVINDTKASYGNVGAALQLLLASDKATALAAAKKLETEESSTIIDGIGKAYASTGDVQYLPFFESRLAKMQGGSAFSFMENYSEIVRKLDTDKQTASAKLLETLAVNMNNGMYSRFAATRTVKDLRDAAKVSNNAALQTVLQGMIDNIKSKETNKTLQGYYSGF
ncbi:MAG: hypothetical protein RI894_368, partial [Bacteroidota bacterium]